MEQSISEFEHKGLVKRITDYIFDLDGFGPYIQFVVYFAAFFFFYGESEGFREGFHYFISVMRYVIHGEEF